MLIRTRSPLLLLALAALGLSALAPAAQGAALDVTRILKGIQDRYNHIQTLEVNFAYTYTFRGRNRTEKGTLYLRKPGRMRWQYSSPAGKLFISDGKFVYDYNPAAHRVEKTSLKEEDDLRGPLAFLLGKLDFQRDFRQFEAKPQGADVFITALPKSNKLIYTKVSFLAAPDYTIKQLTVTGQDGSSYTYFFDSEEKNPKLADSMFRFTPPPGTQFIDSSRENQ
jgi:outer membrane lipoprotein carrier protein